MLAPVLKTIRTLWFVWMAIYALLFRTSLMVAENAELWQSGRHTTYRPLTGSDYFYMACVILFAILSFVGGLAREHEWELPFKKLRAYLTFALLMFVMIVFAPLALVWVGLWFKHGETFSVFGGGMVLGYVLVIAPFWIGALLGNRRGAAGLPSGGSIASGD